jgi:hypothetical protein
VLLLLLYAVSEPIPQPLPFKEKGRGAKYYNTASYTLPLLFKGRVGDGLRMKKQKVEFLEIAF